MRYLKLFESFKEINMEYVRGIDDKLNHELISDIILLSTEAEDKGFEIDFSICTPTYINIAIININPNIESEYFKYRGVYYDKQTFSSDKMYFLDDDICYYFSITKSVSDIEEPIDNSEEPIDYIDINDIVGRDGTSREATKYVRSIIKKIENKFNIEIIEVAESEQALIFRS